LGEGVLHEMKFSNTITVLLLVAPFASGRVRDGVASNLDTRTTLLEDAHRSDRDRGSPTSGRGS
jgi:hypothetical protein